MKARILLLPGDGVGPEVIDQARRALKAVSGLFGHKSRGKRGHLRARREGRVADLVVPPPSLIRHDLARFLIGNGEI